MARYSRIPVGSRPEVYYQRKSPGLSCFTSDQAEASLVEAVPESRSERYGRGLPCARFCSGVRRSESAKPRGIDRFVVKESTAQQQRGGVSTFRSAASCVCGKTSVFMNRMTFITRNKCSLLSVASSLVVVVNCQRVVVLFIFN